MPDHLILWVDFATDQYLSLPEDRKQAVDQRLRELATSPTERSVYDSDLDRWTTEFPGGLILYIFSARHQRIVILRLVDLA